MDPGNEEMTSMDDTALLEIKHDPDSETPDSPGVKVWH